MRTLLIVCLAIQSFAQPPQASRTEEKQSSQAKDYGSKSRPQSPSPPPASAPSRIDQPSTGNQEDPTDKKANQVWQKAFAPETWSNWALFIAAVAATCIAIKSLGVIKRQTLEAIGAGTLAKDALHLTERADILVCRVTMSTHPKFTGDTIIRIIFKNFGRTRANRVQMNGKLLFVPEIEVIQKGPEIVAAVLGAGATRPIAFQPFRASMTEETLDRIVRETLLLRFEAEVIYFDVFQKRHRTKCSGTFMPDPCIFRLDANQEAD